MSDLYGEREEQTYEGIWPSLNKFLLVLILVTLTIPIAYSFMPGVAQLTRVKAQIEELNSKIEIERMKLANLQRQEFLLRNSPEYVALIARDKLDLMQTGETIYRYDEQGAGRQVPTIR